MKNFLSRGTRAKLDAKVRNNKVRSKLKNHTMADCATILERELDPEGGVHLTQWNVLTSFQRTGKKKPWHQGLSHRLQPKTKGNKGVRVPRRKPRIKIGATVRLRSGSPDMTVILQDSKPLSPDDRLYVMWGEGSKIKSAWIADAALMVSPTDIQ